MFATDSRGSDPRPGPNEYRKPFEVEVDAELLPSAMRLSHRRHSRRDMLGAHGKQRKAVVQLRTKAEALALVARAKKLQWMTQKAAHWGTTVWNNADDNVGMHDGRPFDYEMYAQFHPECVDVEPFKEADYCGEFRNLGETDDRAVELSKMLAARERMGGDGGVSPKTEVA